MTKAIVNHHGPIGAAEQFAIDHGATIDNHLQTARATDQYVSFDELRADFNKSPEAFPDGFIEHVLISLGYEIIDQ